MTKSPYTDLKDSRHHFPDEASELILVEGDSAAKSVCRVRNLETQAVLAMQGKPRNAIKSSRLSIERNEWLMDLVKAVGAGWDEQVEADQRRYHRITLLFDPDADGIHCGVLMMFFFYRWMRPIVDAGVLQVIRPPMHQITVTSPHDKTWQQTIHAHSDEHHRQILAALSRRPVTIESQRRYRGLGNIDAGVLQQTCVNPATRSVDPISTGDVETAIKIFGPAPRLVTR